MPARLHRTPSEAITGTVRETVAVGGFTFQIDRPADPDALLKNPVVLAAGANDEFVPHWVKLWPVARLLAAAVLREPWETYPRPVRVLEVGCGLGLAGIACLARGLDVTFSDVDETALAFAATNARLNGFTEFRTLPLDFRSPPENEPFEVVIGSDVIYQDRLVEPLVRLLRTVLAPGGVCLIADPGRPDGPRFGWKLEAARFAVETDTVGLGELGAHTPAAKMYRIRRPLTAPPP